MINPIPVWRRPFAPECTIIAMDHMDLWRMEILNYLGVPHALLGALHSLSQS